MVIDYWSLENFLHLASNIKARREFLWIFIVQLLFHVTFYVNALKSYWNNVFFYCLKWGLRLRIAFQLTTCSHFHSFHIFLKFKFKKCLFFFFGKTWNGKRLYAPTKYSRLSVIEDTILMIKTLRDHTEISYPFTRTKRTHVEREKT